MLKQELFLKLLRFGIVGVIVMLIFMGLTQLFANWWGEQKGFWAAYPIALAVHYSLNRWWAFGSTRTDSRKQLLEYVVMVAVTALINWTVYTALLKWTTITPALAAGAANIAQMGISFLAMDRRVFTKAPTVP